MHTECEKENQVIFYPSEAQMESTLSTFFIKKINFDKYGNFFHKLEKVTHNWFPRR